MMAIIKNQSIPPSLQEQFHQAIGVRHYKKGRKVTANINYKAFKAKQESVKGVFLQAIFDAATWIDGQWAKLPNHAISASYLNQRQNLLAGVFDSQYWYTATQLTDMTEYGEPLVEPFTGEINPAYNDPLRQQSKCTFNAPSKTYATPTGQGTQNEPAPGWAGTVINTVWRDLWFAQRKLIFSLPVTVKETDQRPIILILDSTINATASFRGSNSWFKRGAWVRFYKAGLESDLGPPYLITKWRNEDQTPIALPSEQLSGWEYTNQITSLRNARYRAPFVFSGKNNRIELVITTPPSRGLYFARNDNVAVYHTENVNIYIGRSPND